MKSLDKKLRLIEAGKYTPAQFILADAKDPDMAFGAAANGPVDLAQPQGTGPYRSKAVFHEAIKTIVKQKVMDVMLGSVSNIEPLARAGVFAKSSVTPAIRANDTTDIWLPRGSSYAKQPSRPFRTANLAQAKKFCDLGLYSITFNNVLDTDYESIAAYGEFRADAAHHKFRHFLEVFNPNAARDLPPETMPGFVNDSIVRVLAGVARAERPSFLKVAFNGAKWMDELASHDPSLIIGILGGSAGTTRDTFELLTQAERNGARVALFGRKINLAESPIDLVALFRPVIERNIAPQEAVKAYHATLKSRKIAAKRSLEDDLVVTEAVLEGYRK
jgi:hypothetical protein